MWIPCLITQKMKNLKRLGFLFAIGLIGMIGLLYVNIAFHSNQNSEDNNPIAATSVHYKMPSLLPTAWFK